MQSVYYKKPLVVTSNLDGEWKSTIIDDNLYLSAADWDSETFYGRPYPERTVFENMELPHKEAEYIKLHQRG